MMFRNTYRMLLSNFGTFWKDFFYKLIMLGVVVLLTLPVISNITSLPEFQTFATEAEKLFLTMPFVDMVAYFDGFYNLLGLFFALCSALFNAHLFTAIYISILYLFIIPFLFELSSLGVTEVLYGSMASLTRYNYGASYIKKLVKSLGYAFLNSLISLVFVVGTFSATYGILYLGEMGRISMLFVPMLMLLAVLVIMGFKITFLSGWAPSIVVFNCGVVKGFKKGLVAVGRRFFKTYSTVAMILLVNILGMSIFGIVSLIAILPLMNMAFLIFQMIMFFGSQGMRYYVDTDTILSPKKLEETDKFENAKYLI